MIKAYSKIGLLALICMSFFFAGCDKTKPYDTIIPPAQAHFTGSSTQIYSVLSATTPVYNVEVGTTDVSNVDRTVTYNITSPTNAGTNQYSIASGNTTGTVTIPAGQATANIPIQGKFAAYDATGRKDTLVITLSEPSIKPAAFLNRVTVILRGPCFEGDVTLSAFAGAFKAIETFGSGSPYGPYNVTVTNITQTSATTGRITVNNVFDDGWGPIDFLLDWTNPASRTVTVVAQAAVPGSNAGQISSTYSGQTVAVRPFVTPTVANTGTFSACNNTLTLRMQLGVTGVGYFGSVYTVNLTR